MKVKITPTQMDFGKIQEGQAFLYKDIPYIKIHKIEYYDEEGIMYLYNAVNLITGHSYCFEFGDVVDFRPDAELTM